MGQKVNPHGLRVGVIKNWDSRWFAKDGLSYVITCIVILSFSYRSVIFSMYVSSVVWRRKWLRSPVFLPGESHEQRSLVGYSLWGCKESDRTEATSHAYMYTGSVVIHRLSMLMF